MGIWLGALCAIALHLLLLDYVLPPEAVLDRVPLHGADYDTHIGQAYRMAHSLRRWGEVWSYDPQLLAGFPAGTIFDADNKGWGYLTYLLQQAGLPPGQAFNGFVLLCHMLVPLVVFTAARLFGLSMPAAVIAMPMASLLWFFDSWARWMWWVGMVAYAFCSFLVLLPLSLFYRYMQRPRALTAALCAVCLGLTLMVHPYAFIVLAPSMGALYLRDARRRPLPQQLGVLSIAAVAFLINAQWLAAALSHWHYILDSAFYAQTGLAFLVSDFFDLLRSPTDTGVIGTRAGFRFLYLALACVALLRLRKASDPRVLAFAVGIGVCFALGYFGNHIPGAGQVQPYRHTLPMGFLCVLPAAWLVDDWRRTRPLSGLAGHVRAVVYIAMALGAQHLTGEVLYFYSHSLPRVQPLLHGSPSPLHALGYPAAGYFASSDARHFTLPHSPDVDPGTNRMLAWLGKHLGVDGRALVEELALGERLAWRSDVEVIGGFRERNLEHSHANLLRTYDSREIPPDVLSRWLQTYAVDWLVMRYEHPELDAMTDLLQPARIVHHRRVYRVIHPTPRLDGTPGRIRARPNELRVLGTDTDADAIIRYHFHERLRCRPDCRIERLPSEFDEVGLMRVPAPHPADFLIELVYP